jgi:hypothetical protein
MTVNQAGKSRAARLDGINKRDINIRFRVATDKVLAGGNLFVYAFGRRSGTSEYRPRIILNGNGTISAGASVVVNGAESALGSSVVVPGLTQSANSFLWVRAEITGASPTTIRVKVWADGQSEPADWNYSVTNSQSGLQGPGSVGLRTYLGSGGSNAPLTISFDDYTVTATQ